ncbi:MAG: alpha/beta fold hydrolase [Candidatus Saccharibacteria bacterium]|nr:alpha/beta fold hydrolase [Candidatus Saccharibacteria bacterium]
MKQVVLIHGKDRTSRDLWYPWISSELAKRGVRCIIPDINHETVPKIREWLEAIDNLHPDKETILVGHSRGGMAILRWLETPGRAISKAILVATNSALIADDAGGDFYSGPFDFDTIRSNCQDFRLLHSEDDQWVPYQAALENAAGLNAKVLTYNDRGHFTRQQNGSPLTEFPDLLHEILN